MSIKGELDKGFTVGDITTSKYDEEAKIKVKDFYALDKMNRAKVLQLASLTDIELAKRDLKIADIEEQVEDLEAGGGSGGGTGQGAHYNSLDSFSSYGYVFHRFTVPQEDLDTLTGELTLDRYNSLSAAIKTDIANILARVGITDPTDLTALTSELGYLNTQVGALITKIYLDSIRISINKEFNYIHSDKIGLSKRVATTKVLEIILTKLPNGSFDATHSTIIRNSTIPKVNSIHAFSNYPMYDTSSNFVKVINFLDSGNPTNEFGVCIEGSFGNAMDGPSYVGDYELEKIPRADFNIANRYHANPTTLDVSVSTTGYGDTTKFTTRSITISDYSKFLTFNMNIRYNVAIVSSINILENVPCYYFPFFNSSTAPWCDFNFYGSDGSISKGRLVGVSTSSQTCKIIHYGNLASNVLYTACFQLKGGFQ